MTARRHVTAGPRRPTRGHRVLPHPADVGLAFWAPTRADAFDEAARGLLALLGVQPSSGPAIVPDQCWRVTGADDVERLFKLLAQLVWAADTPAGVPAAVRVREGAGGAVEVEATGRGTRGPEGYDVKAVTYHEMAFGPVEGGWAGRAYFDI